MDGVDTRAVFEDNAQRPVHAPGKRAVDVSASVVSTGAAEANSKPLGPSYWEEGVGKFGRFA